MSLEDQMRTLVETHGIHQVRAALQRQEQNVAEEQTIRRLPGTTTDNVLPTTLDATGHLNPPDSGAGTLIMLSQADRSRLSKTEQRIEQKVHCISLRRSTFHDSEVNLNVLRERAFNFRWAESDADTIPLTAADPDFPTAPCITEAMASYVSEGYFSYGPNRGLPAFREAVAKVLRERKGLQNITAEHVLPTNSAATGIFQVVKSILSSSSTPDTPEVIVMDPIDFLLVSSVEKNGGIVRRWSITRDQGLDWESLEKLVNENTALFSFCNPNNPFGRVFTPIELRNIGLFAERHDLKILSDDIWSDIVYKDSPRYTSIAAVENGRFAYRTVKVFGFSKSFGLAGLRIGYVCTLNEDMLEEVATSAAVDFTADGATTLSQVAAQAAYEHAWPWFDQFLHHLEEAREFCVQKCKSNPGLEKCHAYPPWGTYVMLIDIRPVIHEVELDLFVQWASSQYKVRVVPGNERFFGPGSKGHIRICFATSLKILDQALDRLGLALIHWSDEQSQ